MIGCLSSGTERRFGTPIEPQRTFPASPDVSRTEYELAVSFSLLWWIPYRKYTNSPVEKIKSRFSLEKYDLKHN